VAEFAPFICGDTVLDIDGNIYNTLLIDEQCWMAKNLNTGVKLDVTTEPNTSDAIIEKWCLRDDCDQYGGLYSWNEAMQGSTQEEARGVCPVNWHIPDGNDWTILQRVAMESVGANNVCADESGWQCSPANEVLKSSNFGFNLLYSGYRNAYVGNPGSISSSSAYYWTSTNMTLSAAFAMNFSNGTWVWHDFQGQKKWGASIRCIKN